MEATLSESPPKQSYRKHVVSDSIKWPAGVSSLRVALKQNSGEVRGAGLKSPKLSSEAKNVGAPAKVPARKVQTSKGSQMLPIAKTRKSRGSLKLPIEVSSASDLELLRELKPIVLHQR